MRILKLFVLIISIILLSIFIEPSRNFILRKTSEYLLSTDFFSIEIDKIESNRSEIRIKNALLKLRGKETATLDSVKIKYDLMEMWRNKKIVIEIDILDNGTILGEETSVEAHTKFVSSSLNHRSFLIDIKRISSKILSNVGIEDLDGKCGIVWKRKDIFIDNCYVRDKSEFNLMVNGEFDGDSFKELMLEGNIKKLPEDLHKELYRLLPDSKLLGYLNSSFSGSLISNGSWSINFPKEFFKDFKIKPEYLSGKFNIENVDYKYLESYPEVKNIKSELAINGSILNFKINSAKASDTKVMEGNVKIDLNQEDISVNVDVATKGPTKDLIDYIGEEVLQNILDQGINLNTLEGVSESYVKLHIPLSDEEIKFDISTKSKNTKLSIFDKNILLTKGAINGDFDGNILKIDGRGKINGFESDIKFINDISGKGDFDQKLEIKSILEKTKEFNRAPFFDINEGKANLAISYEARRDYSYFSAKSDLTNVGYNVSKLGLFKNKGQKALLKISGESESKDSPLPLVISLIGDNIHIEGMTTLSPEITQIYFPKIINNNTKYSANINMDKDLVQVDIYGKFIDISNSNMMSFLSKDASSTASDIKIKFDNVKLKNEIYLDNFILDLVCGKEKCSTGILSADLGTKKILLTLHPHENYEEWKILVTNAGAFLEGLGIVENIKAGTLNMSIKTNIKSVKKGDLIPIAEGSLLMERFVAVDNKFLTKLVSNLSLPGLLSTITNSNNVSFSQMSGKFDYTQDVINIYEGKAEGPYMDLTIKGKIDTDKKAVQILGKVTPSIYGINSIFNRVPILGRIVGGKNKSGILSAPYSIEHNY